MTEQGVVIGAGGWLAVERGDNVRWFVRVLDRDGTLEIDEVYAKGAVTAGGLTKLMKAAAVWLERDDVMKMIRARIGEPGPDLAGAMEWFDQVPRVDRLDVNGRAMLWQEEMLIAQVTPPEPDAEWNALGGGRDARRLGEPYRGITSLPPAPSAGEIVAWRRGDLDLGVKPGEPYPDDFYERVADAHERAVSDARLRGARPAPTAEIADENGVPLSQAKRWVREAERRGFLESVGQGRPARRKRRD